MGADLAAVVCIVEPQLLERAPAPLAGRGLGQIVESAEAADPGARAAAALEHEREQFPPDQIGPDDAVVVFPQVFRQWQVMPLVVRPALKVAGDLFVDDSLVQASKPVAID